jgi:hypothetical protein
MNGSVIFATLVPRGSVAENSVNNRRRLEIVAGAARPHFDLHDAVGGLELSQSLLPQTL